jgi:hypothetical protein
MMIKNPIQKLKPLYTEAIASQARNKIVNGDWEKDDILPREVRLFKKAFKDSLFFLRQPGCKREHKTMFIECIFRAELRILLYQVVNIKKMPVEDAEETCQEIIIALMKRILGNDDNPDPDAKPVKVYKLEKDDYKSFVYYCLQIIKNYRMEELETVVDIYVEEYSTNGNIKN